MRKIYLFIRNTSNLGLERIKKNKLERVRIKILKEQRKCN